MNELITQINDAIWGYVLIAALITCGIWFTWKTRGVQFRMVGEMIRLLTDSATSGTGSLSDKDKNHKHISSFQAFAVSVATRVGTGNLAGVATAIAIGGPGAVFWMWVIALIGSATAFIESTLGQLYKQRHKDSFIGGPAYYIEKGLHCKWMAYLFAVLITITFGLSYNSIQSNTICGAMQEAFGWNPLIVGGILSVVALIIIFGGLHRIANVSLNSEIGAFGPTFIAIAILLFAFSSIIGNYYYGEANIRFMTSSNTVLTVYRLFSGGVLVMFGAMASLEIVWNLGDLCMALLTACNLVAIISLGKYAFRLLEDYRQQKRRGIKEPVFHRGQLPEIEKDLMCWE